MLPLTRSRNRARFFGIPFSPLSLFAQGEQGTWYDPSDFSTLFEDSAGTTPVTGVEQVVGRMLDKSGNGNHATSTGAARPTLSALYNIFTGTATLATQTKTTLAAAYTLSFSGAGSVTLSGTATGTFNAGTHSVTCTAGSLTATVSGTVTNADMRLTSDLLKGPAYQAVVTATNYDSSGFLPYLVDTATTQGMATGSIVFTGDEMSLFAGVTRLSNQNGVIAELSATVASNNGVVALISGAPTTSQVQFTSKGTAASTTDTADLAPATSVYTGLADISLDRNTLREDGVVSANSSADQGTGNYGTHALNLMARNNAASLHLNGRVYGFIMVNRLVTESEQNATEAWLAQRTGVTLPVDYNFLTTAGGDELTDALGNPLFASAIY